MEKLFPISLKTRSLKKIFVYLLIYLFSGVSILSAQSYQFSKYSVDEGLPQQYVYSLNQDNKGFIWVGTGDGISKFDGIEFQNFTTKDGMAENFVSCSAQRHKNIIWLGHNKGGISRIIDGKILSIVSDSLVGSKITDILVDQDNYVWATSQNGYIIRISPRLEVKKFDLFANQKNIQSIAGKIEGNLLIGTDEGLFLWSLNDKLDPASFVEIKALKLKSVTCITTSKSLKKNYWIGTGEGLYQLKFTNGIKFKVRHYDDANINLANIQHIEEDDSKNLLIATYSGLFKLLYDKKLGGVNKVIHFNEANGINNFVKTSLVDREGNTWIGTYGDGLSMLKDEIFTFYQNGLENVANDTRSFYYQDSVKWFGLSTGLLKNTPYDTEKWKFYGVENGFKNVAVTCIVRRGDELFLGTDGEGLYRFNTKKETFKKEFLVTSYLSNSIHGMVASVNDLWIATEGGLIQKNLTTNKSVVYNTLTGLRHNSVFDIQLLKDGRIAVGSHSNELTYIKNGEVSHQLVADFDQLMDVIDITVDDKNNLWLATLGNGVFKQEADSFVQISSEQGLKSDYCYSIIFDQKNGFWIGHRGGLSRINKDNLSVQVFDSKKGINADFNKGANYIDRDKNIWFGTDKKIIKFNPKKFSKNTIPPAVSIKNIYISDNKIPTIQTINLPYGIYKLKIEFIGISFKDPDGVKYQHFLKGYDLDWSESSFINFADYPRITDGTYTFYVKACNNDGFCSDETLAFTIIVAQPFWKKWWFILGAILTIILIIFLIIKQREKKQKEIQKNLEIELEKRTKEVVKKSDELEDKNKSITDSINYALKIQKSILPSKQLMKDYFPESFIFYQPRDIVSGDFYWYEKVGNKFIVACADCTGHGVPGAFMSMISSTLFKEIANQFKITDPSAFLYKLDSLLKSTLKKSERGKIHDGLDLSVAVFDLDTNYLEFSGAYRPVIFYRDGQLELIKTTPHSIGGDDFIKKEFKTIGLQLKKGDLVYLFSDGFPDQFGGEKGKKLYIKGFKTLIENSADINMDEQHLLFKRFLSDWMGDLKQVDDVLVMGIKIS